jgi:hypothetical protein
MNIIRVGELIDLFCWDHFGGNNLEFLREDNGSFSRKMILNGAGMRIFGEQLSIGTANEQLNLGYGSAGQFLAMGYRPVTTTTYQSLGSGGIVMYNNGSGSWGLATKDGGSLNINDDTHMIVTAQGNAGIGTLTPTQRMHLHDEKKAALRLDTDADGSWDVLADGMAGELVINQEGGAGDWFCYSLSLRSIPFVLLDLTSSIEITIR